MHVQIVDDDGRQVLQVDGVIQSVWPADAERWGSYWAAMVPPFAPQRGLLLGLGGATLPYLIVKRWGSGAAMTGVDDDPGRPQTRQRGWLAGYPGLEPSRPTPLPMCARAQPASTTSRSTCTAGRGRPARLLARPFVARLLRLLEPSAWLCLNLYAAAVSPRRLAALGELAHVEYQLTVGENVVVHLRPHAPTDASRRA